MATSKNKKPAMTKVEIAAQVQMETGYSVSHILHVMNGTRQNAQITKAVKQVKKNSK